MRRACMIDLFGAPGLKVQRIGAKFSTLKDKHLLL